MQARMRSIIGFIVMCTVGLMMGTSVHAGEFPRLKAVLDRLGDGVHDLRGRQIQCDAERPIGVMIEAGSVAELLLDGLELRDCAVGVYVQSTAQVISRHQHFVMPEATTTAITVAWWIEGGGSVLEGNTVSGFAIGFYLAGPLNTVQSNTITGSTLKAIYIVDHFNVVTGNLINGSGTGIHVFSNAPMTRPTVALFELAVPAQGNMISGNDVTCTAKNCVALWDSTRDCAGDPEDWFTTWSGNIVRTGRVLDKNGTAPAGCIQ